LMMALAFLFIVGQAIVRGLPITSCGCFGDFITVPLYVIFLFDSLMLFVINFLMRQPTRAGVFSLDRYFAGDK
ncbi:MAG TPA: hypothetical protein PKV41_05625, partial [Candidatus Omnitrophota bacterium]|nr:hypothetical protein [Candidatus Omnitrophota bacterium]